MFFRVREKLKRVFGPFCMQNHLGLDSLAVGDGLAVLGTYAAASREVRKG